MAIARRDDFAGAAEPAAMKANGSVVDVTSQRLSEQPSGRNAAPPSAQNTK
jgi:hypothetical protein